MDNSTKEALVITGCTLGLIPVLFGWQTSYEELSTKYRWRSYSLCPEFRFGVSTLLLGGLMYRIFRK